MILSQLIDGPFDVRLELIITACGYLTLRMYRVNCERKGIAYVTLGHSLFMSDLAAGKRLVRGLLSYH
jgi:hypothetical protein